VCFIILERLAEIFFAWKKYSELHWTGYYSVSILTKTGVAGQFFIKFSNIKFYESSGIFYIQPDRQKDKAVFRRAPQTREQA
jgi:hypothetical protein